MNSPPKHPKKKPSKKLPETAQQALFDKVSPEPVSCSGYVANAFRLCLHAASYRLMTAVRDRAAEVSPDLGRRQFDTLRLKLLKVGALVSESVWKRSCKSAGFRRSSPIRPLPS